MMLQCFPLRQGPASGVGTTGGWRITSYFGGRIDPITGRPGNHGGEDIAGFQQGEPYYAVVDGYVSQGWDPSGGGNWTTLYGMNGTRFGYGHASSFAPGVNGKTVPAGTVIAYAGTTGASTGVHLHFAYDSEDAGTAYDDPFDVLQECASAGRFPGAVNQQPLPPPPEGLTMAQYEDIMGGIARLEKVLGTNLQMEGQWEQDTRTIVIDGVEQVVHQQAGAITEAGWSSRPYPFRYDDGPDTYFFVPSASSPSGVGRSWIPSEDERAVLTKVLLNPHVQVLPSNERAVHDKLYPCVNPPR